MGSQWEGDTCAPSTLAAITTLGVLQGCQIFGVASVIGQNIEREKKIEVLAEYDGLRNQTVAVLVQTDMATLYQFPSMVADIAVNLSRRIQMNVEGVQVLNPAAVLDWTYHQPGWEMMPYGEVCEELGVDRVVWIDVFEFRLNPPGNRWQWEGVAGASIGIVEADGFDQGETRQALELPTTYRSLSRPPSLLGGRSSSRPPIVVPTS